MIVRPDFCEHFKTKALVELTGDPAAPLAVLYLWGHCQTSRRWEFPEMSPEQLAALCRWGKRKPACHTALIKAGFLDKLSPRGFKARQWDEHNGQLIQKWSVGTKGGRPKKGAGKGDENNRTVSDRIAADNRTKTDQTRLDQTRMKGLQANPGGGEGLEGGASADGMDGAEGRESGAACEVPKFEPLDKGLFRHELEAMAAQCRQKIEFIKADPKNVTRTDKLTDKAREDVGWYEEEIDRADKSADMEKLERLRKELGAYVRQPSSYQQAGWSPKVLAALKAWRRRIAEIEKAMLGVQS